MECMCQYIVQQIMTLWPLVSASQSYFLKWYRKTFSKNNNLCLVDWVYLKAQTRSNFKVESATFSSLFNTQVAHQKIDRVSSYISDYGLTHSILTGKHNIIALQHASECPTHIERPWGCIQAKPNHTLNPYVCLCNPYWNLYWLTGRDWDAECAATSNSVKPKVIITDTHIKNHGTLNRETVVRL